MYDSEEVRDQVRIDTLRFALRSADGVAALPDAEIAALWDAFLVSIGKVKAAIDAFINAFVEWARAVVAPLLAAFRESAQQLTEKLGFIVDLMEPQEPRPPHWREVSRRPYVKPVRPIDQVRAGRRMLYHQARRS